MPFDRLITNEQLEKIYELKDQGLSLRAIGDAVGYTKDTVNYYLKKRVKENNGNAALASVAQARDLVRSTSVFDIVAGLEKCLYETETLLKMDSSKAPLRDKLAVRSELRQLFREARETLESIHNIQLFHAYIETVTSILERQDPTARKILYDELERVAMGSGVSGIFGPRGAGQAKPVRHGRSGGGVSILDQPGPDPEFNIGDEPATEPEPAS